MTSSAVTATGEGPRAEEAPASGKEAARQVGGAVAAQNQPGDREAPDEAIRLHLEGVAGDDDAAERALGRLIELHGADPADNLTAAYLGSARVLAAKRYLAPWKKGETCMQGLALLDEAVESAPEDLEIRFLRAVSTYPLPAFFRRRAESAADFAWLAARCEKAVEDERLSPAVAALSLVRHGDVHAPDDLASARDAWQLACELAPGTEAAREAAEKLADTEPHRAD